MVDERPRVRILLTNGEFAEIDRAAADTGANTSLLVVEAIQFSLPRFDYSKVQTRRTHRVDVRVPEELKDALKRAAEAHGLTQQSLLRYLVFQYVKAGRWSRFEEARFPPSAPRDTTHTGAHHHI